MPARPAGHPVRADVQHQRESQADPHPTRSHGRADAGEHGGQGPEQQQRLGLVPEHFRSLPADRGTKGSGRPLNMPVKVARAHQFDPRDNLGFTIR
jgi:hypothetical protein